jgi:hypothetical protein
MHSISIANASASVCKVYQLDMEAAVSRDNSKNKASNSCVVNRLTKPHGQKLRALDTDEVSLALIGNSLCQQCLSTACTLHNTCSKLDPHCLQLQVLCYQAKDVLLVAVASLAGD